jgi:hypothetical protein
MHFSRFLTHEMFNPESVTEFFAKADFALNCCTSDQQENMTEYLLRRTVHPLLVSLQSCRVTSSEIIEIDNDIRYLQRRGRDNFLIKQTD